MSKLHQCLPTDLDEDEIGYYIKALELDPHCGGAMAVGQALVSGDAQLFVHNDDDAIIVIITRFINSPDGYKELLIHMMAGSGGDEKVMDMFVSGDLSTQLMDYAVRNRAHGLVSFMFKNLWENIEHDPDMKWHATHVQIELSPGDVYGNE
jgi:hypothetical protein